MNYVNCNLCPRQCGVDRSAGETGFCRCPDTALVAKSMLHKWEEPVLAGNGGSRFPAGCEGTGSVCCQGPDAAGVTLQGLYYPLENGNLTAAFPLGVSNHFTGEEATISVKNGSLLVLWDRKNGIPERMEL